MRDNRRQEGFTLVELLVCIAIIGILAIMQVHAGIKAIRQAKSVATGEAMRQHNLDRIADNVNRGRFDSGDASTRNQCRGAFRQMYDAGRYETAVTEVLYMVRNDREFDAYYHTLVDPDADKELEFEDGKLVAYTRDGDEVLLEPRNDRVGGVPVMWEFLSTNMSHMTTGTSIRVMYNDTHVSNLKYPGRFPATRLVAELGQDYMNKIS